MKFRFLNRFKKEYRKLPKEIQGRADKQLKLLFKDPKHPSLRIRKIVGTKNIWEGSVTDNYRFTFQIEKGLYVMRNIGLHDKTLKNP